MIIRILDGYKSEYEGQQVDQAVGRAIEAATQDGNNTYTGSNKFEGEVDLGSNAVVDTPEIDDNSKKVANTEFVKAQGYMTTITSGDIATALGYTPEDVANKITSLSADSTDDQYPSAKVVYTITNSLSSLIEANTTSIEGNTSVIEAHSSSIAANTSSIQANSSAIAINTSAIATNTFNISVNTSNIATNTTAIGIINSKIPIAATSTNQLADKAFVNSSVATNTAYFIGTFNSVAELEAYSGTLTNNDYAFVVTEDTAGNTLYDRYKYNSSTQEWLYEYELNNSSFTAVQWAAINSGITDVQVTQIATNTSAITNLQTDKQDAITDLETIRSGAAAGATALQPLDNITELTNNAGYISGITASMVVDALTYTPYNATNPSNFQENIIETIKVNGTALTPSTKTVDITIPPDTKNTAGSTNSNSKLYIIGAQTQSDNPQTYSQGSVFISATGVLNAVTPTITANDTQVATTKWVADKGYITGITSVDVIAALGYTPYNASNPNGYITSAAINTLSDTSISNLENDQALLYSTATQKWTNSNIITSISWGDITGSISAQTDLQTILDEKTTMAAVEAKGYLTTVTSTDVTTALGYTPYDGTNPNGYITGISYNDVITALGFTPENTSNRATVITSTSTNTTYPSAKAVYDAIQASAGAASLEDLSDVSISSPIQGQNLTYDSVLGKWKNTSSSATVAWGGITGDIADQTDLNSALAVKTTKFTTVNPALTSSAGVCTWNFTNTIGSKKVQISIYAINTYKEILSSYSVTDSTVSIELISDNDILAGTYEAVIIG